MIYQVKGFGFEKRELGMPRGPRAVDPASTADGRVARIAEKSGGVDSSLPT